MIEIAALYVQKRGSYAGLEGVDPWTEERDARLYAGPLPVVAHPPCSRWCALAGLVQARYGHRKGDDGGCFAAALASVRRWGGVLEHPAHSLAWPAFDLPRPSVAGGWQRGMCGGWSCHVEQARYGHRARKATWLYVFGTDTPPALLWGRTTDPLAWVGYGENRSTKQVERLTKREASKTPPAFRDMLIELARSCSGAATVGA